MGKIIKNKIEYAGGGSGSGDEWKDYIIGPGTEAGWSAYYGRDINDNDYALIREQSGVYFRSEIVDAHLPDKRYVDNAIAGMGIYDSNNNIDIKGKFESGSMNTITIGSRYMGTASNNSYAIGRDVRTFGGDGAIAIGINAMAVNGVTVGNQRVVGSSSGFGGNTVLIGGNNYDINKYPGKSSVAVGRNAVASGENSIALGYGASATRDYELNIRCTVEGSKVNRVIGGVAEGIEQDDAATVAQGNKLMTFAPTVDDEGFLGQLWTDTTAMHTYQCTAIDDTNPDNPVYTWTQRW